MNRCPTIGNALCVCVPNTLWLNLSQPKCSNCYLHRHQDSHQDKGKDLYSLEDERGLLAFWRINKEVTSFSTADSPCSLGVYTVRGPRSCVVWADENNQRGTSMPKRFWRLRGLFVGRFWGMWSSQGSMDGREQGWVVWFKLQAGRTDGIAEMYNT